jgi:glycosyltransferase involved in cell wall biosynthesis
MNSPLVSVVIPAYNQAGFISETVQSVLNQTYPNIEVLVVNDASPDNTSQVVSQINDPRLKLLEHEKNLGLPAARNTGMRASQGELIALLDADDLFLPEKIQSHVDFLNQHPEIGVSYNARFELNHSACNIRDIWRPQLNVGLRDLVLGFPFSPSDMVIRREWAYRVNFFDEIYVCGGEDTDFPCRLALAGCQFAGIDKALNYRRYHSGRKRKNLPCRLEDVTRTLNHTFSDPRCPEDIKALQGTAITHHLMVLVSLAFIQGETDLGQEYLRDLVRIDPGVLEGAPCELVEFLMLESIADASLDHEDLLRSIFAQIPAEYSDLASQYDWAVARGYLIKGIRAMIWDQLEKGSAYLHKAKELGAVVDERFLRDLAYQLSSYETEMGSQATQHCFQALTPYLEAMGARQSIRAMKGQYFADKAFQLYRAGNSAETPAHILQAIRNHPAYLTNRGMVKMLLRSIAVKN